MAGAASDGGSARARFSLSLRKKERARKRIRLRGRIRTTCMEGEDRRRDDAWSRRRCAGRRYGLAYEHSAEQCSTVIHVDHFFTHV